MEKESRNILILMIFVIIIIILILSILVFYLKSMNKDNDVNEEVNTIVEVNLLEDANLTGEVDLSEDTESPNIYKEVFEDVPVPEDYVLVKSILKKYYTFIQNANINNNVADSNAENTKENGILGIKQLLDDEYVNGNSNIDDKILQEISKYNTIQKDINTEYNVLIKDFI